MAADADEGGEVGGGEDDHVGLVDHLMVLLAPPVVVGGEEFLVFVAVVGARDVAAGVHDEVVEVHIRRGGGGGGWVGDEEEEGGGEEKEEEERSDHGHLHHRHGRPASSGIECVRVGKWNGCNREISRDFEDFESSSMDIGITAGQVIETPF